MKDARPCILPFGGVWPRLGADVYVAPTASVIGQVVVGDRSSLWFGAVLRGDDGEIRVGQDSNVQDNAVLHCTMRDGVRTPVVVGDRVSIGHAVSLHSCVVRDACIIGMGSTVMDGAEIGERVLVGAGSLVSPGTRIPPGVLALGAPARPRRDLTAEELRWLETSAAHYRLRAATYRAEALARGAAEA